MVVATSGIPLYSMRGAALRAGKLAQRHHQGSGFPEELYFKNVEKETEKKPELHENCSSLLPRPRGSDEST